MNVDATDLLVRKLESTIIEREEAISKLDEAALTVASLRAEANAIAEHADRVERDNAYLRTYSADMAARTENSEAWASALWETLNEHTPVSFAAKRVDDTARIAELEQRTVMRCVQALTEMVVLSSGAKATALHEAAQLLKAGAWKHFSWEADGE